MAEGDLLAVGGPADVHGDLVMVARGEEAATLLRGAALSFLEHSGKGEDVHQEQLREGEQIRCRRPVEHLFMHGVVSVKPDGVRPLLQGGSDLVFRRQAVDSFTEGSRGIEGNVPRGDIQRFSAHRAAGIPISPSQVGRCLEIEPGDVIRQALRDFECGDGRIRAKQFASRIKKVPLFFVEGSMVHGFHHQPATAVPAHHEHQARPVLACARGEICDRVERHIFLEAVRAGRREDRQ